MTRTALLKHVRGLLQKRGLTPDADVKEMLNHQRRFFRTRCVDAKGRAYTFKVYLMRVPTTRHDFQHEIAFYHFTAKARLNQFPRWVEGNRTGAHPWILYHYIPGELFTAYLRKHRNHVPPKLIANLSHMLAHYGQLPIPLATRRLLHLQAHRASDFTARFRTYARGKNGQTLRTYLSDAELEVAARIVAFHQLERHTRHQLGISHGDLSTNNLLVDQGRFAVLDWEHIQIASPAYDVAELWVKEFSRAPWRNRLVKKVADLQPDHAAFSALFAIEVLLFCLRDILLHHRILSELHHTKNKVIVRKLLRYYVRTFRAGLHGFSSLMKNA
ncbi:MAG: aminoglycoside phosphotransferase family protein [Patescibacteria group bacterium]|jgi:aminoglycoside phosphotransferase (APT) family kinase protein